MTCFKFNNQWIELQGKGKENLPCSALQSLLAKPKLGSEGFFMASKVQMGKMPNPENGKLSVFGAVFQEPRGLPPKRNQEHVIHLLEGQGPVNVRPSRYSHHHKNEIKKQVQDMLQTGIIRHS